MVSDKDDAARFLAAFGMRIKLLRIRRGLTQAQFAERASLDRTFVGFVERGQRGVNITELPGLAAAAGVAIGELFSDDVLSRRPPDGR
jgi:transcriptional regulator with XRE-family HTH domain